MAQKIYLISIPGIDTGQQTTRGGKNIDTMGKQIM